MVVDTKGSAGKGDTLPKQGPCVHAARRSCFRYLQKGAEGREWTVRSVDDTAGRVALRVHSGLMDINLTSGDQGPGSPQSRQIVREQMNPSGLRLVKGRGSGSGVHLSSGEARMIADLLDELGAAMPPPDTEQLSRRALVLSTLLWDRWRA